MKKISIAFALCLLSFAHSTHCSTTSMEEYGIFGIGIITSYTGLKIMYASTKKNGTKKQGLLGALLTGTGVYMMTAGPGKIKAFQKSNSRGNRLWKKMNAATRKKLAVRALNGQIQRESRQWAQYGLIGLRAAIENDPTGFLAKNVPWSYLVRANIS